jgi:hypothetical protein
MVNIFLEEQVGTRVDSFKGCTVLHTGLISCSTGTSIRARGPDSPALGSQRGSSYHELRTLLPPNKSYQVRLASVEPRTSRRHVRHNFITSEGEIPVQCLTTEPRPDEQGQGSIHISAKGTEKQIQIVLQPPLTGGNAHSLPDLPFAPSIGLPRSSQILLTSSPRISKIQLQVEP